MMPLGASSLVASPSRRRPWHGNGTLFRWCNGLSGREKNGRRRRPWPVLQQLAMVAARFISSNQTPVKCSAVSCNSQCVCLPCSMGLPVRPDRHPRAVRGAQPLTPPLLDAGARTSAMGGRCACASPNGL